MKSYREWWNWNSATISTNCVEVPHASGTVELQYLSLMFISTNNNNNNLMVCCFFVTFYGKIASLVDGARQQIRRFLVRYKWMMHFYCECSSYRMFALMATTLKRFLLPFFISILVIFFVIGFSAYSIQVRTKSYI